jgi:hypothetical protein
MSTGDLQRLERTERLLESALHDADRIPVDLGRGRARLAPCLVEQQRSVRRRWVICAAASVFALIVTAAIVLAGLRGDKDSLPIAPSPELTFSPSGLPVGVLVANVDRTEPQATSNVRIVVRPDGTGTWNAGTVGDSAGPSVHDYEVQFVADGPGSALMRQFDAACVTPRAMSLDFIVRGRTIVIKKARSFDCLVSRGLISDLTGTTMRILPLSGT